MSVDKKTIAKKLARLSDNIRLTVELIHARYGQGQPLRYADIRRAREEKGMNAGSQSTLQQAFQAWRDIYGINEPTYNTPQELESLVKRTITQIRGEVERHYRQEAEVKVAAAEEMVDLTGNRLKDIKAELNVQTETVEQQATEIEQLTQQLHASLAANEALSEKHQALEKAYGQLSYEKATVENEVTALKQALSTQEQALQQARKDMESQRHDHMVTIDEWKTQAKEASKVAESTRQKLEKAEQRNRELEVTNKQADEKLKHVQTQFKNELSVVKTELQQKIKAIDTVSKQCEALTLKATKLQTLLEAEQARNQEQQKTLLQHVEKLLKTNQGQAKKAASK